MDLLSVVGILIALSAIVVGQYLEGGHVSMLLNGPAILIVVGGTVGATMVQSPLPVFVRSMRMLKWIVVPPQRRMDKTMNDLVRWSKVARREGLLGLENLVEAVPSAYARKGLQLLIDGNEPETIRETLELDSLARESRDLQAAQVLDGMGGYAPTLGILGAVIGLIHVMNNLSDPARLGQGIAVAFVATIYGVGLANLMFIPAGNKLKALIREETREQEMIMVGVVAIAEGENPRVVQARVQGLVD